MASFRALFPLRFGFLRQAGSEPILADDVKDCVKGLSKEGSELVVEQADGLGNTSTQRLSGFGGGTQNLVPIEIAVGNTKGPLYATATMPAGDYVRGADPVAVSWDLTSDAPVGMAINSGDNAVLDLPIFPHDEVLGLWYVYNDGTTDLAQTSNLWQGGSVSSSNLTILANLILSIRWAKLGPDFPTPFLDIRLNRDATLTGNETLKIYAMVARGAQGSVGDTGPAGADGMDGAQGADGMDGTAGAPGAQGAPGTDGMDGQDGTGGTVVSANPGGSPATALSTITIAGVDYSITGSGGTTVVANPGGSGLTTLTSITIGTTSYEVAGAVADGSITAVKLASNAVTTIKIAPDAVTFTRLGNDSVGTPKILNNAVTNEKLGGDISGDKITAGTVDADYLPFNIVSISQTDYDALTTVVATTLYVIPEA